MSSGFFRKLFVPRSPAEDDRRREFILNILLTCSVGLMLAANIINLYYFLFTAYEKGNSLSVGGFLLILGMFIGLFALSRGGHFKLAARAFIGIYFAITTMMALLWGIDLPAVPLFYGLIIIMAGILIDSLRALLTTAGTAATMVLIAGLQIYRLVPINSYWRRENMDFGNIFLFALILSIIAVISWLFNRDLEESLARARLSEAALKEERNSLEIKFEERVDQIKKMQIEKMVQLYRLAEFGRLASGIFHDLVNPLTALSLNLAQAKKKCQNLMLIKKKPAIRAGRIYICSSP